MHLKMAAGRELGSGLIKSTARQKREGARGAVRGWLGLGLDALQSVEVSMKSIFQSTSSRERRNNVIVMWPCRVPAGI